MLRAVALNVRRLLANAHKPMHSSTPTDWIVVVHLVTNLFDTSAHDPISTCV